MPSKVYRLTNRPEEPDLTQTLWPVHCVAGTHSANFVDPVLRCLPVPLQDMLADKAKMRMKSLLHLMHEGKRGNVFHVIRKGLSPDMDSYGIAYENDGWTPTFAPLLFKKLAADLCRAHVGQVLIGIGGLATNFCVEFSHNQLHKTLIPDLKDHGILASVVFLPEISRGVLLETPDGSWPDLSAAPLRMARRGTQIMGNREFLKLCARRARSNT